MITIEEQKDLDRRFQIHEHAHDMYDLLRTIKLVYEEGDQDDLAAFMDEEGLRQISLLQEAIEQ